MNLKKFLPWVSQLDDSATKEREPKTSASENNLVYLNNIQEENTLQLDPKLNLTSSTSRPTTKGLMNDQELVTFFAQNHFGHGWQNGAHFKTQEALDLGRSEVIANFQNACVEVLERRQAKINKLQSEIITIDGLSLRTTKRLELACTQMERETKQLQGQIDLAQEGKGWVLEALNRYQIGFHKGMQEAVEFELMAV